MGSSSTPATISFRPWFQIAAFTASGIGSQTQTGSSRTTPRSIGSGTERREAAAGGECVYSFGRVSSYRGCISERVRPE